MENVLEQVNVVTKNSPESLTTGIIQEFIQDDINQEVDSLSLENEDANRIIAKLECFSDPLLSETKGLLSKVVKDNLSRIGALQEQLRD